MKTIRFILILSLSIICINSCFSQRDKIGMDKEFIMFLNKFKTVEPPLNYKKISQPIPLMSKEEAMRFLHKKEDELYTIEIDYGYDTDEISYYKEEHTAGCDFKYQLNDSIYILCTREGGQGDSSNVYLNSFTLQGKLKNKCCVGEKFTFESDWVSFVLLDKTHVRVFYYVDNNARIKEGFLSTVYYVNYEITNDGKFVEKDKSNIMWLKNWANNYSTYKPQSDDPMNEYE